MTGGPGSERSPSRVERALSLSVVVATCNRAPDLARLFESLKRSVGMTPDEWEVLVVDNRSTDDTPNVIAEYQRGGALPLRALAEPRQGKSYALNRAVEEVRGQVVAFTDDDIIVSPDWAHLTVQYFQTHPDATCAGGMVLLYDPADADTSTRTSTTAARVDAKGFSPIFIPIMGCNMAVRSQVLRAVGQFDTDLGPGTRIGGAEDLDFLYRLIRAGYALDYAPNISVFHNHGRRGGAASARLYRSYVSGRGAFYCKHILQGDKLVARWAYWECVNLVSRRLFGLPFNKAARLDVKRLWMLAVGAIRYAHHRLLRSPWLRPTAAVITYALGLNTGH